MNTTINIDIFSVIIFLGVFLGIILSAFFIIKHSPNGQANRYQGLLLLSLSLVFLEQVFNYTGFIVRILPVTYSTAWLNFLIGPFLYLYVSVSLEPQKQNRTWINFVLPGIYLIYLVFSLVQSNDFKYNRYVFSLNLDLPLREVHQIISSDPLNINRYLDLILGLQIMLYIFLSFTKVVKKSAEAGTTIFKTEDDVLKSVRNVILHMCVIIVIFIIVKISFRGNAGNYFIGTYIAIFILLTTFRIMDDSTYFDRSASFLDISIGKYRKSSLTEVGKQDILKSIVAEFETRHYFTENLGSLSDLSKKIGESPHHVSQVLNEKLHKSFFEVMASYRVEEAKKILAGDKKNKLTVEEVSEMVGYNSKTAFNNAFRKLTGKTPSEFRKISNV